MAQKDHQQIWKTTLAQIEIKLDSPSYYKTFFQGAELVEISGGKAVIKVANPYASDWLRQKYHRLIKDTISHVYGQELEPAYIERAGTDEPVLVTQASSTQTAPSLMDVSNGMHVSVTEAIQKAGLNIKYSLANFVVGDSNRFAHAAATAVIDNLGTSYNPLFIYGSTGVGKTHIAQAIARTVLERNPNKRVQYTTSEGFLNDMVKGLRSNKMPEFRAKYRHISVLIIDDIQMISKWVATQGEFFNTFNEMHNSNSQIILIADRRPEEIRDIEDRLRSRFQGGMVVHMDQPDYELRLAILEKKANEQRIEVSPRIMSVIAKDINDNVRELEGALQTVALFNQMKGGHELSIEEVSQIIGTDHKSKREKVKLPAVLKQVAKSFDVTVKDLKGERRTKEVALARQVAMYILREEFGYKLEEVAGFLNRSDHTTVMHAIDKVKSLLLTTEGFREQIALISRRLQEGTVAELT